MKRVVFTKDQLAQMIKEFVQSRNKWEDIEQYCSERELAQEVLNEFMGYSFEQGKEKDKRYAEYLKLKKEFE